MGHRYFHLWCCRSQVALFMVVVICFMGVVVCFVGIIVCFVGIVVCFVGVVICFVGVIVHFVGVVVCGLSRLWVSSFMVVSIMLLGSGERRCNRKCNHDWDHGCISLLTSWVSILDC